ncbi:MAG: hypothetical protein H0X71_03540 [Rubrobacter sp.]|nr:hypothetical protein [Rubrobacter sp.]
MEGIRVRWARSEDEAGIAELLELNGMPRWEAFEERFIVALGSEGKVLAALRYRTVSKRLLLGLLVADPWAGERVLAKSLYAGAASLAREMEVKEVVADGYGDYPYEAGYYWGRGSWRLETGWTLEVRGELPAGGWRRVLALLSVVAVPFCRTFHSRGEEFEVWAAPHDDPTPKIDPRR